VLLQRVQPLCEPLLAACRDQLYFANISLCIFDEATSGFYLDGKFMEPRSDDSLQKLASNLDKQRAGSILRTVEAQLLYVGSDMYETYSIQKAELRWSTATSTTASQGQQLVLVLKRSMEDSPQVNHCSCIHNPILSWPVLPIKFEDSLSSPPP
jgi:hypothetical protein